MAARSLRSAASLKWDSIADDFTSALRIQAGKNPQDTALNQLVGEIELTGDALELTGDGLTLIAYTAEPASQAQQQLDLLASWHADDTKRTTAELNTHLH